MLKKRRKNPCLKINPDKAIDLKFYLGSLVLFIVPTILGLIGLACIIDELYSIHWLLASGAGFIFVLIFYLAIYKWLSWIVKRWF